MISKGVRHMIVAGIFFSLMNLGVRLLAGAIPAIEVVFFRSLISLIISLYIIRKLRINPLGNNRKILLFRGLFGAISLAMYFTTLQYLPFASAVTLQQLTPIFTTILAIFILGEKVKKLQWFFFLIAFSGVAMIKGFDNNIDLFNFLLAIGATIFAALAYNMVRKLKDTDHPIVVVLYFPLVALPIAGLLCFWNWETPQGIEWLILLGIGVSTQIAQVQMTKAMQMEEMQKVMIFRYLSIVYAILFGLFLFDEHYNLQIFIGIALVVGGVILNLIYRRRLNKKKVVKS